MESKHIEYIKQMKDIKSYENVSLKNYTSFKLNEKASMIVYPSSTSSIVELLKYLDKEKIKHKILGNGSNLIFINDYDGVLIKLDELNNLDINDTVITVGAGYSLTKLAIKVSKMGLTGLEFATGIPGTVGGAVYMNAGAYKSDMGYIVSQIKVLTPNYQIKTLYNKDLDFHYRSSFLQKNPGYICLEATIVLKNGNKDEINELIEERKQRRLMTQPLEYPSAGSVFRNPDNDYAGRLIESIGYKNRNVNDAYVSEKHANFIINKGSATGKDIKELIKEIQNNVKKEFGIELKAEQEFVE